MIVEIKPATLKDCEFVAANMRETDKAEVWASHHLAPIDALKHGLVSHGDTLTAFIDGVPVCVFGCSPRSLLSSTGVPWMLGTDELEKHAFAVCKRNKKMIRKWRTEYALLTNWIDDRNETTKRWLTWLGFTLFEPQPFGAEQLPFCRFEMLGEK